MTIGVIKDIEKEYLQAVKYYEKALSDQFYIAPVENYINLAFIYWSFAAQHFEFNIPNNIPDEWSVIGGNNYDLVIQKGIEKYPDNLELHFWQRYFDSMLYASNFTKDDCLNLINTYNSSDTLVTSFFLYLFNKEKYQEDWNRLIEDCIKLPTAKNLYIYSFLK